MTSRKFYKASDPEPSPPPPFLVLVWKPGADCHGAWHADDAGGCRPTAASGGPGCGSRLTGVLAPRVEACEEFCNSFGVPETSPLWRRLWSIGAWRSLASALDWGSRGRRFKSCRPDWLV